MRRTPMMSTWDSSPPLQGYIPEHGHAKRRRSGKNWNSMLEAKMSSN
jgi:hypothetical protein